MLNLLTANPRIWAGLPTAPAQLPVRVTGLNKSQAEDLLDWLEANGCLDYRLTYVAGQGFSVSFFRKHPANDPADLPPWRR